jgi:hypothetical protein
MTTATISSMQIARRIVDTSLLTRRGAFLVSGYVLFVAGLNGLAAWQTWLRGADWTSLAKHQMQALLRYYGTDVSGVATACPSPLAMGTALASTLLPVVSILIAADTVVSDRVAGVLHCEILRSGRISAFFGRVAGAAASVGLLLLIVYGLLAMISFAFGAAGAGPSLVWGARLWLCASVLALPYIALGVSLSAVSRTVTMTLLVGMAIVFALCCIRVTQSLPVHVNEWLLPSANEPHFFWASSLGAALSCTAHLMLWAGIVSGLGCAAFAARDV